MQLFTSKTSPNWCVHFSSNWVQIPYSYHQPIQKYSISDFKFEFLDTDTQPNIIILEIGMKYLKL